MRKLKAAMRRGSKEDEDEGSPIRKQPEGKEDSDSEHSHRGNDRKEGETSSSSSVFSRFKSKFKRNKKKGKKTGNKRKEKEGDTTDAETTTDNPSTGAETSPDDDDSDSHVEKPESAIQDNAALKTGFEKSDKMQTVFVTARIIEARDIRGGSLRVRVRLNGRQKATRVTTELHPKWKQNINFFIENTLEKAAEKTLDVQVFSVRRVLPDKLIGEWDCSLGMIMHQPQGSVMSKWISLAPPKDPKGGRRLEGVGFIKVSLAVFSAEGSAPLFGEEDENESEEIFNGSHFSAYTLRIRLHRMQQIANEIVYNVRKQGKKKEPRFYIRVTAGSSKEDSAHEYLSSHTISFNQEILLPFLWPTVVNKINFTFIMQRGRKQRVIAQTSLPLRELYAAGEDGFMPQFGPSFLNFYGHEHLPKLKLFKEKQPIQEEEGCKFYGRMLVTIECIELMSEFTEKSSLSYAAMHYSKQFEKTHRYTLYCTFFACNHINPKFASDTISFQVSIGDYGSSDWNTPQTRTSTLGAMPDYDDCKYFYMPWGNHKPMTEVPCLFENIQHRLERTNAILKVADMLDTLIEDAFSLGPSNNDGICAVAVEALEHACYMIDLIEMHHDPSRFCTKLDFLHQENRRTVLIHMKEELIALKYESLPLLEAGEEAIRALSRVRDGLRRLAHDPSTSIPEVIVKMVVNKKVVGYARVDPNEIFFSDDEGLRGRFCGRVRSVPVNWTDANGKKSLTDEVPAILHLKMWMGRNGRRDQFIGSIQPAEAKNFYEVYHYQSKLPLCDWKSLGHYTDYGDLVEVQKKGPEAVPGWTYAGFWAVRNTHDRWIAADIGKVVYDDKVYELQQRNAQKWKFVGYTDAFGATIAARALDNPPKGWAYEGQWSPDLHAPGDREGFMYSVSGLFNGEGQADKEMRITHQFRRRILKRTRRKESSRGEAGMDLVAVEQGMGMHEHWEYSPKKDGIYHDKMMMDDSYRRRRFVIPLMKDQNLPAKNFFVTRMFEVHDTVSQWQLRAYIFWAKDLLPVTREFSSRAFVRVSYMHMTKQTAVVDKTANPVFNETLIYDKLLIPGAHNTITECPPAIHVEVKGERHDDTECFLGRFYVRPTVICSATDKRAEMRWHTLRFSKGKTRGAILCAFELFLRDVNHKVDLPLTPARKGKTSQMEVPAELRPQFSKYTIQMLCWGVRNLTRHQLLSVRRPFVEMLFGDAEYRTEMLRDVTVNPNWMDPLVTFNDVMLPDCLDLAPPLVLNLYDSRAFRRKPLIGVCLVSNYKMYVKKASLEKKNTASDANWIAFEEWVGVEETKDSQMIAAVTDRSSLESFDKDHRIDWWSKYYTSIGHPEKAPGFPESGIECMRIFNWALEDTAEYKKFMDFLDTFSFKKSARGNFDDHEEKEITGQLKGRLFIRKHDNEKEPPLVLPPGIEFTGVVRCVIRVYVVGAANLILENTKHACDSYVMVTLGKMKQNRKKQYRPDCVDPEYGELFEFEADIPLEKDVRITVMNRRMIIRDEEIGFTTIDLENRLLTKFRGTVGLSRQYTVQGPLTWRDQTSPLATLNRYCRRMNLSPPEILTRPREDAAAPVEAKTQSAPANGEKRADGAGGEEVGLKMLGTDFWLSDIERDQKVNLNIVGRPAQRVALFILHKMGLVPEHVESRPLFSSHGGKMEVGRVKCWIDILPRGIGQISGPIDISVRVPEVYQLRLAVLNVTNAVVCKRSFGSAVGDLYVKAFINGQKKGQRTDIHYRVTDGFGSFNWRLVIDFEYNPWEKKVYVKEKGRLFRKSRKELVDPVVVLQLWDNNKFKKDTLLGEMVIDLTGFREGLMDISEIDAVYYSDIRTRNTCCRCICFFWSHRCRCCCNCKKKTRRDNKVPLPKAPPYKPPPPDGSVYKPFENPHLHGYWPVLIKGRDLPDEQKMDYDARKKKNDDLDVEEDREYVTGIVEMEMSLLPKDEADADKVGKKRKNPNHSPHLPAPERSAWDSHWLLSRLKPGLKWFWNKFGKMILLWLVIIILVVLIVGSIIYAIPDIGVAVVKEVI